MRAIAVLFFAVLLVLAAACAPLKYAQDISFYDSTENSAKDEQQRLVTVASRITRHIADLCPDGMTLPQSSSLARPELCGYPVKISERKGIYASTNGKRIKISRGLIRFTATDDELALVLGHELSHILLDHSGVMRSSLIRNAELEADRLGISIVARAGYNTETAARFLPRLAKAFHYLNEPQDTYPTPAARAASIRLAIDEIARQEARNDPHQALQGLAPPIWP